MNKDTAAKIKHLEGYQDKPIGIFGARASGKTIFFTVLYGLSGFNNDRGKFSVICSDKESRTYLKKNYGFLLDGKLPPRTEINDITSINMSYFYNKNNYALRSFDFAGELLKDDGGEGASNEFFHELQNKIYSFFLNCSGILFFVEPAPDKKEGFERQTEIDKLLSFLKEQKGKWDFDIPIGLVITKWDKISNEIAEKSLSVLKYNGEELSSVQEKLYSGSVEDEQKKVEEYVKNHPIYNNIYSLLSGVSQHVHIFPVSAFGQAKENDLPPNELKPFNLFTPLTWVAEKRDAEWQRKVLDILHSKVSLKNAEKVYYNFKSNVENSSLLAKVQETFLELKRKKIRNRIIAGTIIAVIIAAFLSYSAFFNISQKNLYTKILQDKTISKEEKIKKIDSFFTKFGFFNKHLSKYIANNDYSKKLIKESESLYLSLIYSETDYNKKTFFIDKFTQTYPQSLYLTDVKEIREFNIFSKTISGESDNLKKHKLLLSFLSKHPKFKNKQIVLTEARKYLSISERFSYEDIMNFSKTFPVQVDVLFGKIETYLSIAEFQEYRKEISEMKENIKDEYLYKNITKSMNDYNISLDPAYLQECARQCESYLSNSSVGRYLETVKSILAQTNKINQGVNMEVEFYGSSDNTDIKYLELQIRLGKKNYSLEPKTLNGDSIYIGSFVGNIQLTSDIEVKSYLIQARGSEEEFPPRIFKLNDANHFVYLTGSKGTNIGLQMKVNTDNFKLE